MSSPAPASVFRVELRGALKGFALVAIGVLLATSFDLGFPGQALLQSLRFHLAVVVAVLVVALWVGRARFTGLLLAALLAASVGEGAMIVLRQQAARFEPAGPPALTLKYLHFNVLAMNANGAAIADMVAASGADIAVILEAPPLVEHLAQLQAVFPYRVGCDDPATCDLMLLSRYPIVDAQVITLGELWQRRCIIATLDVGGRKVTAVAAHIAKPYYDEAARFELYGLARRLAGIEGPLVLSGDFNSAPWAYAVDQLVRNQHLLPAPGYPGTWPVRLGDLGVPIDNIFTRGALITAVSALPAMGSNHRGLTAEVAVWE